MAFPRLRPLWPALALAITILVIAGASRAEIRVQILASDPPSAATLGRWERFFLRIGYKTDQPVVLSAQPYFMGKRVSAPTGGSPRVGPGEGEAYFWFAVVEAQKVDMVAVTAETERGKVLAESRIAVDLTWTGAPRAVERARAPWVQQRLDAEKRAQAERKSSPFDEQPGWLDGIAIAFMAAVPLYPVMQLLLLWRMRGGWRMATALPLILMVPVLLYTVFAYLHGSNIFPLVLIFTSPLAALYLLVIMLLRRFAAQPA